MPGPVSFETLVSYVGEQVQRVVAALDHLGREMDRHQEYHRGLLEEQLRQRSRNGWSWTQTVINVVVAVVAVASLVLAANFHR